MSVFPLLGSNLAQKSLVFSNHFRATPVRNNAASPPRAAWFSFDPATLLFIPSIPSVPRNINVTSGLSGVSQIGNPPLPQMLNIMSALNVVFIRMFFKGFHGRLNRALQRVLFPLTIRFPSIGLLIKCLIAFNIYGRIFSEFGIKEIPPLKKVQTVAVNRTRAGSLSFYVEGANNDR